VRSKEAQVQQNDRLKLRGRCTAAARLKAPAPRDRLKLPFAPSPPRPPFTSVDKRRPRPNLPSTCLHRQTPPSSLASLPSYIPSFNTRPRSEVKDSLGAGGVYSQAHCVGSFFAAMSKWAREFGYSVKGLEDERLSSYVMGTSGGEEEVAGVQSALDSGDLWLVAREVLKYFENEEGGRADHARRAAEAVRAAGRVRGAVWTKNTSEDAKSSIRCEFAVGEEKAVGEGETKRLIDCAMDICGGGEISMQRGAEFRGSVKMYPEQMFMACVKLS